MSTPQGEEVPLEPEEPTRYFAIRITDGASVGWPGIKFGVGASVTYLQIQNLETGQIGTFGATALTGGVGVGFGISSGTGEWLNFRTAEPELLESFTGRFRQTNLQIWELSLVTRLTFSVDLDYGSRLANIYNGDSLDISQLANSLGADLSEGIGKLRLFHVEQGTPSPTFDDNVRLFDEAHPAGQPQAAPPADFRMTPPDDPFPPPLVEQPPPLPFTDAQPAAPARQAEHAQQDVNPNQTSPHPPEQTQQQAGSPEPSGRATDHGANNQITDDDTGGQGGGNPSPGQFPATHHAQDAPQGDDQDDRMPPLLTEPTVDVSNDPMFNAFTMVPPDSLQQAQHTGPDTAGHTNEGPSQTDFVPPDQFNGSSGNADHNRQHAGNDSRAAGHDGGAGHQNDASAQAQDEEHAASEAAVQAAQEQMAAQQAAANAAHAQQFKGG